MLVCRKRSQPVDDRGGPVCRPHRELPAQARRDERLVDVHSGVSVSDRLFCVEIDWKRLTRLEAAQLQVEMLALVEEAIDRLDETTGADAVAALPEPLKTLWLLDWLDFEIAQGSMLAYLHNSHGQFAADAAEALGNIGASRMASVLRQAIDVRQASEVGWQELLETLTGEYWAAADKEDWGRLLDDYLARSVRYHGEQTA